MRILLLALAAFVSCAAAAADVKILTVPAYRPIVQAVAPAWEKRTGNKVKFVEDDFDLAVLPAGDMAVLGREGVVNENSITSVAKQRGAVFAGAVAVASEHSNAALSLLILLSSEETQKILADKGLTAP